MSLPQLPPEQQSTSKPVLYLALAVSGAAALTGVLAAVDGVPRWVLIVLAAIIAVGSAWGGILTGQRTVPWADTAAKRTPSGAIILGPAANVPDRLVGAPAEVTVAGPSPYSQPMDGGPVDDGGAGMNRP